MNIEQELMNEKRIATTVLKKAKSDIAKYEDKVGGRSLCCRICHNTPQYYIDGKYVSKEKKSLVQSIAQLEYGKKVQKRAEEEIKVLNKTLKLYEQGLIESIYSDMSEGRKNVVNPYVESKEEFIQNWIDEEYIPLDRWEDVKSSFYTSKNERVRSKSELLIANELERYGVPYRYECPLVLMDGKKECTVHPDFMALNRRTLKVMIIEHLGMLDNQGYYASNLSKLDLYEKNGYLLGRDFLILHETSYSPINVKVVKDYIKEYLL